MKTKTRNILIGVGAFTLIGVVGNIADGGNDSDKATADSSIVSEVMVEMTEPVKMTADEFAKQFVDNVDDAEKECEGKSFEITGEYVKDIYGTTIILHTKEGFFNSYECDLRFDIEKAEFEKIPDLELGDTITLKAEFENVMSYTLNFANTVYIDSQKAEKPTTEAATTQTSAETTTKIQSTTEAPTEPVQEVITEVVTDPPAPVVTEPTPEPVPDPPAEAKVIRFILNTDTNCVHASSGCTAAKSILPENYAEIDIPENELTNYAGVYWACGRCSKTYSDELPKSD